MTKRGRKPAIPRQSAKVANKQASLSTPLDRVPEPPDHLGDASKAYWRKLAPQLIAARILTDLHLESFAVLCEVYGEYQYWNLLLSKDPSLCTICTKTGYRQKSPEVTIRDAALSTLQKLWPKFGMTPFALAQMKKHGGIAASSLPPVVEFAKGKYADEGEDEFEDAEPDE